MSKPCDRPAETESVKVDLNQKECPKCRGEVDFGFGLMGGGYGTYVYCVEDGCDYFEKEQVDE